MSTANIAYRNDSLTTNAQTKSLWRTACIPSEHGGWSLTIEPVVLGLLVAWSTSGFILGIATILTFMVHTPIKLVLVDVKRDRWLDRSQYALRVAIAELIIISALTFLAFRFADDKNFWIPIAIAMPMVAIKLLFDVRSRSRRLVPELAGTIGMSSIVAAIVLSSGAPLSIAFGLWVVVSVRVIAAIPYVRTQVFRIHNRPTNLWHSDIAQATAIAIILIAAKVLHIELIVVISIMAIAIFNVIAIRRPVSKALYVGIQQMTFGAVVIIIAALSVNY